MLGIAAFGQLAFAQFPQGIPQLFPKRRDGGSSGWDSLKKRHPSVYSEEYYDALRPQLEAPEAFFEIPIPTPVPVANLRIPLNRLIRGMAVPTLSQLPPYRPMPSLTTNPPPFRMTTPEEMVMDDAMIITALLSED